MTINLPCECDAEEHEVIAYPEWNFGQLGYNGDGVGHVLPCGRVMTQDDVDYVCKSIQEWTIDEG